jgi:hypothetical protein
MKNSTCFEQTYCPSSGDLILYSQQMVFVLLVMLTVDMLLARFGSILTSLADCQHNYSSMTNTNFCEYSINPLTPNDNYSGRTAPLTSKRCILYIYSTNIGTEYFKHGTYSQFFSLQNAVCFIILTYLVRILPHFIYRMC